MSAVFIFAPIHTLIALIPHCCSAKLLRFFWHWIFMSFSLCQRFYSVDFTWLNGVLMLCFCLDQFLFVTMNPNIWILQSYSISFRPRRLILASVQAFLVVGNFILVFVLVILISLVFSDHCFYRIAVLSWKSPNFFKLSCCSVNSSF